MRIEIHSERKWDREKSEERFRKATLSAMRENGSVSISPSDVGRHAGVSKALIYRYFGSMDGLIAEVIEKRLVFPSIDDLLIGLDMNEDEAFAVGALTVRVANAFDLRPDVLDLIGWGLGGMNVHAAGVVRELRRFCDELAKRSIGKNELASLFLGQIVSLICERQLSSVRGSADPEHRPARG